ncbi:pickpocket protein 28-like [Culex pipiens pallens]|uniref:pickpocket protein 28-like n=1 Tax=Culex pipiens pallens TaxID=42434 RepID=UPI0019546E38|nr:pickpocket protein 28-like [Culex pipiens pallens]
MKCVNRTHYIFNSKGCNLLVTSNTMYGEKSSVRSEVKPRDWWNYFTLLLKEFCRESSIHGLKYIVGSNRALIEKFVNNLTLLDTQFKHPSRRIWWLVVSCLSLYGCGNLIHNIFNKWQQDPVIVSFATKQVPIYKIPFPSVTICPEIKVKMSQLNFTQAYYDAIAGSLTEQSDPERIGKLLAMMQVCDFNMYDIFTNETYDDDCIKMLKLMKLQQEEIFVECQWRGDATNCTEKFRPTLTAKGICYTFNSLSGEDMMRTEQLNTEYRYVTETRNILNWSLDRGYSPGSTRGVYPQRVLGAGIGGGLNVVIKANVSDMDNLCSNTFQGFRVMLHMPVEYPELNLRSFRMPLEQEVVVSVIPEVVKTSPEVRSYTPERRQCYYSKERYLRFFRMYSLENCQMECLTNYTIQRCGCVKYSMPRPPDVRICGLTKVNCYKRAATEMLMSRAKMIKLEKTHYKDSCDCLASCTTVRYHIELSQSNFNWKQLLPVAKEFGKSLDGVQISSLVIMFRTEGFIPVVRRELYGTTDLLANAGGLLGLFMGISILSLVEILYFCSIKPLLMWWRGDIGVKQVSPVISYTNQEGFAERDKFKSYNMDKFYVK